MKPQSHSILFPALIAGFAITSAHAAPLIGGTEIGVDFGPTTPSNFFNQVNPDPAADGSLAAGTLIDTSGDLVDGVGFSWSAASGWFNNNDAVDSGPAVFDTSNRTDWLGISQSGGPTGTITLTFSGLDDLLTYDLVIGAAFGQNIADTSWEVDGQTLLAEATTANAYRFFTGLSTDGAGNLVITGTGATNRLDIAVVSALHLTAVGTVSESFQLTITPATAPDTGFDLEWESQAGKLYNVRTSTDLAGPIAGWTLVTGGEDIAATPPSNSFNVDADVARRFFAVEEFAAPPPPPLLSEDFETGDGGFTVATVEGSAWERGAPDSSGFGGTVSAGNDGSANAWGTNLGTLSTAAGTPTDAEKGIFINPTTTALRTPVLDLTAAAGAALTFAEAMDFPATDTAVVNIINATTDDIIAQIHVSTDPNINGDASWADVDPIDLAAGLGQQVRIEWRFTGTGGDFNDFLGWYIDDVLVTETTP